MRDETVSRSYAETLFALARRDDALEEFVRGIAEVGKLLDENPDFRLFLETPRIDVEAKKRVVGKVFTDVLPRPLLNFVLITIDKRRQRLLRDIARAFHALVDEHAGRVHVEVTVARELDDDTLEHVGRKLSTLLDRKAIPHVRVNPEILGGIVVRTGDTVFDGSLRRRLEDMRRRLNEVTLPEAAPLGAES